ncbi:MAG: hypothetical protein U5Q44_07335 [Dehalococcoidia bacterium]|nr:hypothetical protein [Dehalococcoidia bacterium]
MARQRSMALGIDQASPLPGAAVVGMASLAVFGAGLAAMHLLQPDLNPRHRYISEYVLGDAGFVMVIAFTGPRCRVLRHGVGVPPRDAMVARHGCR